MRDSLARTAKPRGYLIALLVAGYIILAASWFGANPPGGAPDETPHYLRAAGISQGSLIGKPVIGNPSEWPRARDVPRLGLTWLREVSRNVDLPVRLNPPAWHECYVFHPERSAACVISERAPTDGTRWTYVGVYQPYPYLASAALMRIASNPTDALVLSRLGIAALALPLLCLAMVVLWQGRRDGWAMMGILLATTPMVVFLAVMMTPSGVEIAAAVCFFAGLSRLAHARSRPTNLLWLAIGAGGFVLAVARPLSWIWVAIGLASFLVMIPGGISWRRVPHDRRALLGFAVLVAGLFLSVSWGVVVHQRFVASPGDVLLTLGAATGTVGDMGVQEIAVFGWTDTRTSPIVVAAWLLMVAGLVLGALVLGSRRQRLGLLGLIATNYAMMVALSAVFLTFFGPAQGRYTLPLAVGIPLYAGEILYERRAAVPPFVRRALPVLIACIVGVCQAVAWWSNARRYAVGTAGRFMFPLDPGAWQPPWGWWPWLAMAVIGVACPIGALLLASRAVDPVPTITGGHLTNVSRANG
jgi:hypothetical protein